MVYPPSLHFFSTWLTAQRGVDRRKSRVMTSHCYQQKIETIEEFQKSKFDYVYPDAYKILFLKNNFLEKFRTVRGPANLDQKCILRGASEENSKNWSLMHPELIFRMEKAIFYTPCISVDTLFQSIPHFNRYPIGYINRKSLFSAI